MPKCSDIRHAYGELNGQWVEQYYFQREDGQVFVLKTNYPPRGEWSKTPPARVAAENGLCTFEPEPQLAPQTVETTELASEPTPTTTPSAIDFNGGGVLLLLAVAGCTIGGYFIYQSKEKNKQSAYDRAATTSVYKKPLSLPTKLQPLNEDDLILQKILHQTPVAVAVKELWDYLPGTPEFEEKKSFYLRVRKDFEQQYPESVFNDSTL